MKARLPQVHQRVESNDQPTSGGAQTSLPGPGGQGRRRVRRLARDSNSAAVRAAEIAEVAEAGTQGGGSTLPFLEQIQASFGHHDVSGLKAHVGGSAARAAEAMGTGAYAVGDAAAFSRAPDLRTAAHEAAHHVQKQAGVQPGGPVGRAGDGLERHADRVADLVVRGQSAEPVLDELGARSTAGADRDAVQADGGLLDWAIDRLGDWTDTRTDEERLDAEEDLEDFMAGDYSAEHFHPSTGRGNFDADYDPGAGRLLISLSVFFRFRDGSPGNPDWVANTSAGDPTFNAAEFQWTDEEEAGFAAKTIALVQRHWSRRYTFHCTRQYWEALPDVDVDIEITPAADAAGAHYNLEVFKWPDDRVRDAHIDRPGVDHGGSHAGHQVAGGTDPDHVGGELNESPDEGGGSLHVSHFAWDTSTRGAYGQADADNPSPILFDDGSAEVSAADRTSIRTFAATMGGAAMPDFALAVTGHASSVGDRDSNQRLSEDRARNVSNELVAGGVKSQPLTRGVGETGATDAPEWRRVDIVIGDFESTQTTVLHEFGHIFGLADEYPSADSGSRPVGTPVAHSQLGEDLGLAGEPVVAHHSDSIMSNGEVIEPYHYATFLEVLGVMTGTTGEWAAGPGPGPDLGPVDFVPPPAGGPHYA